MTTCLGFKYVNTEPGYSWGMYVDPESIKIPHGTNGEFISNNQPGKMIQQIPGDSILYRGCEVEHWRDPLIGSPGTYQVQAFFHFINKNGPYYPKFEYDGRPGLGFSDTLRTDSQ
jgi:hypothetical protein